MAEAYTSSTEGAPERSQGIVNHLKESATAQLTTQKDRGTDALGRVAAAVRSSTQKLREERHETIATYADKAANQIENWSRRLREKNVDELMSDVQRLARRQPMVFIGSAFALGLVGARFLKSSRQLNEYGYGTESRRTRYGANTSPSTVHDYGAGEREEDAATLSGVATSDVEIDSVAAPSTASGAEGGARSTRGRRSTLRSERS
jgi:hypothetical protein